MSFQPIYPDAVIAAALDECDQNSMLAVAKLGCSRVCVWQFRKRRGDVFDTSIRRNVPRKPLRTDDEFRMALEASKDVIRRSAKWLGVSEYTVRQFMLRDGYIKPPEPTKRRLIPYAGAPRFGRWPQRVGAAA